MAQLALEKFQEYDDLYQIAGAYVSIGKYLNAHGRYSEAFDTLTKALDCVNQHHLLYYHYKADTLDKSVALCRRGYDLHRSTVDYGREG